MYCYQSKTRIGQLQTQEDPMKELSIGQYLSSHPHPNVVRFIECIEDSDHIFSVMEFCDGGELFEWVEQNGAMSEENAKDPFLQIVDGLTHFQRLKVCHRDLSLENVLILSNGQCKIIDFGMSLLMPLNPATNETLKMPPQGSCGKRNYISPEVLSNSDSFYGHLVDVWALGVMLFILLAGVPPVDTATVLDARYRMICENRLGEMLQQWGIHLTSEAVDLLQKLLQADPTRRLTLDEIRNHPWLTTAVAAGSRRHPEAVEMDQG